MPESKKILYKFAIIVLTFFVFCAFLPESIATLAMSAPAQIGFYGDYSSFAELIALLGQSDQAIDNKTNEIKESYVANPCGYFINRHEHKYRKKSRFGIDFSTFSKAVFPSHERRKASRY